MNNRTTIWEVIRFRARLYGVKVPAIHFVQTNKWGKHHIVKSRQLTTICGKGLTRARMVDEGKLCVTCKRLFDHDVTFNRQLLHAFENGDPQPTFLTDPDGNPIIPPVQL